MKTRNRLIVTAFIALSLTVCKNEHDPPPAHVHQWGAWETTKAATCTTAGEQTKVCALDPTHKETQPITIDPNAHQWGAWAQTTPPTVFAEGEETSICAHNPEHKQTRPVNKLESFTVQFNANGGDSTPPDQTIEKGKTATEPAGVTKANNALDGWYKENTFATKWNFTTDTVTAGITLHAKWLCNCNPKDHLGIGEDCPCGGDSCNCTLKVYGRIIDIDRNYNIPIYRNGVIDNEQMTIAVENVIAAYNAMDQMGKTGIDGKINEIHLVPTSFSPSYVYEMKDGKKTLTFRHSRSSNSIRGLLMDISEGSLQPTIVP